MRLEIEDIRRLDGEKLSEINDYAYRLLQDSSILDAIKDIDELCDIIYTLSYKYEEQKDIKYLKLLKMLSEKIYIPYDIRIFLMWQLVRLQHISSNDILYKELEDCGYKTISEEIVRGFECKGLNDVHQNNERMVIITSQFLGYQHSPTRLLLNIIKTINDKYPQIKEVYIFNSLELPISIPCYFYKLAQFSYVQYTTELFEELLETAEITRCGVGYQERNKEMFIEEGLHQLAREIQELSPKYILNIGDHNILADICNKYTDVYTLSISSEYPINATKYLCKWVDVPSIRVEKIEKNQTYLMLPIELGCIANEQKNVVVKERFGIEEAQILAIVGNRLQQEIDSVFIKMLNNLCEKNDKIHIVFIGNITYEEVDNIEKLKYKERVHFLGFINNLRETLGGCDLFINPKRQGGGHGGIAAMQAGIPIITIEYGDIASYLTNLFKVTNYEQMEHVILQILSDDQMLDTYREQIIEVYNQRSYMLGEHLIQYMIDRE